MAPDVSIKANLDTSPNAQSHWWHNHTILPFKMITGLLKEALQFFENAARGIKEVLPLDIIALELQSGLEALGDIIGETTQEAVLDQIFSQFCIGK